MNPVQIEQEQRKETLLKAQAAHPQLHCARSESQENLRGQQDAAKLLNSIKEEKDIIKSTISEAVYGGDEEYEAGKRKANETMDNAGGILNNLLHKASDAVTGVIASTYRKVVIAAINSDVAEPSSVAELSSVPPHIPLPTPVVQERVVDTHATGTYTASPLAHPLPSEDYVEPVESIHVVYAFKAPTSSVAERIAALPTQAAVERVFVAPAPVAAERVVVAPAPILVSSIPADIAADIAVEELQAKAKEVAATTADVVNKATSVASAAAEKGVEYAKAAKDVSVDAASAGVDAIHFASGAAHAVAERAADKLAAGKEAATERIQYAKGAASVVLEKGAEVASETAHVVAEKGVSAVTTAAGIAGMIVGATETVLAPVVDVSAQVAHKAGDVAFGAAHLASDAAHRAGAVASNAAHLAGDVASGAAHLAGDAAYGAAHLAGDAAYGAAHLAGGVASSVGNTAASAASGAAHKAGAAAANTATAVESSTLNAAHLVGDAASAVRQSAANAVHLAGDAASATGGAVSDAAKAVKDSAKSLLSFDSIHTDELAVQISTMSDSEYEKKHAELLEEQVRTAEALRHAYNSINHKPNSHEELRLKREADRATAHLRSAEALRDAQKKNPRSVDTFHKADNILEPSHPLYRMAARGGKPAQ